MESHATHPDVELDVTNMAHGGVGVARLDGRVVFVADAIPGERVRARVTDDRKSSFWRAEAVEVLDASPDRQPHVWAEAGIDRDPVERAGGAEFGHITLERQRTLKADVLEDSLRRFARLERRTEVEAVDGDDERGGLNWRTRVRVHIDADGTVGPFASRSHRVVAVAEHPLATTAIGEALPRQMDASVGDWIDAVETSDGRVRTTIGRGNERLPAETIRERVGDREFRLDAGGFWQVHRGAAATLSGLVGEVLDDALLDPRAANLDLYGGVGLLAAALGDRVGPGLRITSVEADAGATDHAAENLSDWVGARAVTARTDRFLREEIAQAGAAERDRMRRASVVLDPPRQGAGREVVRALVEMAPAQLVYVACDPVALARDLGFFAEGGYELRTLRAVDLFPHTHHLESIALLVPRS